MFKLRATFSQALHVHKNIRKFSKEKKGNFQDMISKICTATHATPDILGSICNEKALGDLEKSFNNAKRALQLKNPTSGTHNSCISTSCALNDPDEVTNCDVVRNHRNILLLQDCNFLLIL